MIETAIYIYLGVSAITLFATACWLGSDEDIDGVDNYWDWIIYSLFWIIQPIKAIVKLFRNLW